MTFNLNLYGNSPAELRALINALADLPGGLTIEHTPSAPHPAQSQNEAVTQPDKPKAPTPVKPKRPHRSPQRPLRRSRQTLMRPKPRLLLRRRIPHRRPRSPRPSSSLIPPCWTRSATSPAASSYRASGTASSRPSRAPALLPSPSCRRRATPQCGSSCSS